MAILAAKLSQELFFTLIINDLRKKGREGEEERAGGEGRQAGKIAISSNKPINQSNKIKLI